MKNKPKQKEDENKTKTGGFWSRKDLILTGLGINFLGFPIAIGLYRITTPLIEESVFNGLLVAISIFIGFISVIVTFYLGKMDERETQFLHALDNARISDREFITSMRQVYSLVSSRKDKTEEQNNALNVLRKTIEDSQANPVYTKESRNNILKETHEFRTVTIRWGIYSLIMYVVALFYSVFALLMIEPNAQDLPQEPLLSLVVSSLFYSTLSIIIWNIFMSIHFWYTGQVSWTFIVIVV